MKIEKRTWSAIRLVSGSAAIIFVGIYLHATWGRIHLTGAPIGWNYVALTFVILCAGYCINGLVWKMLLSAGEKKAGYFDSLYMVSISMLMRYIPGKIWQVAGRYSMACSKGFEKDTVVVSLVEETAADICAGIFVAYAAFGRRMGFAGLLFLAAVAVMVGAMSLKSIRTRLRVPSVRGARIAGATLLYTLNWVGYGCAFFCTIRSLYTIDVTQVLLCAGSMAAGWIGGMVSFVIPNGIGVREGIVALLLSPVISAPQALAAALAFRLISTVMELAYGGLLYYANIVRSKTT